MILSQWGGYLSRGGLCPGISAQGVSGRETSLYSKERAVRILLECVLVEYCGRFRLPLTDPSLYSLITKITRICETKDNEQMLPKASNREGGVYCLPEVRQTSTIQLHLFSQK